MFRTIEFSTKYRIWADCARPETISYIRNSGFNIEPADKWKGSVEDGIEFLKSFKKIIIHPRCKNAAYEAGQYSYKIDKVTEEILPLVVDANNHFWDATRYALNNLIQKKTSIYDFGVMV
jgi:phage terminase large subunit